MQGACVAGLLDLFTCILVLTVHLLALSKELAHPLCRYHPDVNKDELAEAKFKALNEAYAMLLGKGGDASAPGSKNAPFGGNWDLHDWYWSFGMRQRQRRQNPDAAPQHSAASAQAHKPAVHSQITNLKRRAASRRGRCVIC